MQCLHLVAGAGNPLMYGSLGYALNTMNKWQFSEAEFRQKFLRLCRRGLLTWTNWDQAYDHFKNRTLTETMRGQNAIRDMAIFAGGDYSYYKNFDPRDLSTLDKFTPGMQKIKTGRGRTLSREEAIRWGRK
jgi:hypothetical protein